MNLFDFSMIRESNANAIGVARPTGEPDRPVRVSYRLMLVPFKAETSVRVGNHNPAQAPRLRSSATWSLFGVPDEPLQPLHLRNQPRSSTTRFSSSSSNSVKTSAHGGFVSTQLKLKMGSDFRFRALATFNVKKSWRDPLRQCN